MGVTVTLRRTSGQQWSKANKNISGFYKPSPNGRFIIGLPTLLVYHGIPLYLGWIEKDLSNFVGCWDGFKFMALMALALSSDVSSASLKKKNASVLELKELRNLTGWPRGKQQSGKPPKKGWLSEAWCLVLFESCWSWPMMARTRIIMATLTWSYMNLYDLMLFQANDA